MSACLEQEPVKKRKSQVDDDDFVVDLALGDSSESDDDGDTMDVDKDDDFTGAKKRKVAPVRPPVAAKPSQAPKPAAASSQPAKKKAPAAEATTPPAQPARPT